MKKLEKKPQDSKEHYGSFECGSKEPFQERLLSLLGGRSKYQAAKDWGVNLSTLKNYFSRQGSIPRHEVLAKISQAEGVSIDWLIGGQDITAADQPKLLTCGSDTNYISTRLAYLSSQYITSAHAANAWGISNDKLKGLCDGSLEIDSDLLLKIAEIEGISWEWLKLGIGETPPYKSKTSPKKKDVIPTEVDRNLTSLFSTFSASEKEALFKMLARKGIETLLYLLDDVNIDILQRDRKDKIRMLALLENETKKGTSSLADDVAQSSPSSASKKAG